MNGKKAYSILTVALLVVLSFTSGAAWYSTYKIKDYSQTSPGEWEFYFLQSGEFGRLAIEFDWMKCEKANQSAVAFLKERAGHYTDKPGGIDAVYSNEIPQKDERYDYNISEIAQLESKYRDYRPDPFKGEMTLYIIYLNGWYRRDDGNLSKEVLGVTYRASSIAIFRDAVWSGEVGPLAWKREAAVLVHEFGHILGLVNIGYKSAIDHENYTLKKVNNKFVRNYTNHCNDPLCVMYPEIEHQKSNPVVVRDYSNDYCANCTRDLSALKSVFDSGVAYRYVFGFAALFAAVATAAYVYTMLRRRGGVADANLAETDQ